MKKIIITIDGPAGSGKGRIAKYISKNFKLFHIDSGILYRRVAHIIFKNDINFYRKKNIMILIDSLKNLSIRKHKVLRSENIGKIASVIASYDFVRDYVNNQQILATKNIKTKKGFVIDGRDIGSVVFKKAHLKLFVDVDEKIRAQRRYKQLIDLGEKSIYRKILKDIKLRDKKDKSRKNSPLVIPKGAIIIDNSKSFIFTTNQLKQIIGKIH